MTADNRARIYAHLRRHPLGYAAPDIASSLGISPRNVRECLSAMASSGALTRIDRGGVEFDIWRAKEPVR